MPTFNFKSPQSFILSFTNMMEMMVVKEVNVFLNGVHLVLGPGLDYISEYHLGLDPIMTL